MSDSLEQIAEKRDGSRVKRWKLVSICLFFFVVGALGIVSTDFLFDLFVTKYLSIRISLISIFSSMIGASLTIIIIEVMIRFESDFVLFNRIHNTLKSTIFEAFGLKSQGLKSVKNRLEITDIENLILDGDDVFILNNFTPDFSKLKKAIDESTLKGGSVNIVFLNPKSDFVETRARELGSEFSVSRVYGTIIDNISDIESIMKTKENLKVKLFDGNIGCTLYGNEKVLLSGSLLRNTPALQSCFFGIDSGSEVYEKYKTHFVDVWNESTYMSAADVEGLRESMENYWAQKKTETED